MNKIEKLSRLIGREISENDFAIKNEIENAELFTGKTISTKSAIDSLICKHETLNDLDDRIDREYQVNRPCDFAGSLNFGNN